MNQLLEMIRQKDASAFTHSGKFHADDVFSSALLLYLNPEIKSPAETKSRMILTVSYLISDAADMTTTRRTAVSAKMESLMQLSDFYGKILGVKS